MTNKFAKLTVPIKQFEQEISEQTQSKHLWSPNYLIGRLSEQWRYTTKFNGINSIKNQFKWTKGSFYYGYHYHHSLDYFQSFGSALSTCDYPITSGNYDIFIDGQHNYLKETNYFSQTNTSKPNFLCSEKPIMSSTTIYHFLELEHVSYFI